MATIQQLIAEEFIARLVKSEHFDHALIEQLVTLLKEKKMKADDLVKVFTTSPDAEIK